MKKPVDIMTQIVKIEAMANQSLIGLDCPYAALRSIKRTVRALIEQHKGEFSCIEKTRSKPT